MTATMTEPKITHEELPQDVPQEQASASPTGQVINAASGRKLVDECVGFEFRCSEFSPSKGFDDATKQEIAAATGMSLEAVSGAKRLYDKSHPAIKGAREVLTAAKHYVESMSIPMASACNSNTKKPGVRLVRLDQLDEIDNRLQGFKVQIEAAQDRLNDEREDIIDKSSRLLGRKFNPGDYPQTFKLEIDWLPVPVELPEYMAQLAPKSYARAVAKAEEQLQATAELALEEFMSQLKGCVEHLAERTGPVVTAQPRIGSKYAHLTDGEIKIVLRHQHDPQGIPEGQLKVLVAYKPAGKTRQEEAWVGPLTEKDYAEGLRPKANPNATKRFQASTLTNLRDVLTRFRNVGKTLTDSKNFENMIDQVENHLDRLGTDAKDAAAELKNSRLVRTETHQLMTKLTSALDAQITTVQRRRQILQGAAKGTTT